MKIDIVDVHCPNQHTTNNPQNASNDNYDFGIIAAVRWDTSEFVMINYFNLELAPVGKNIDAMINN
jgi:hypothetical protein